MFRNVLCSCWETHCSLVAFALLANSCLRRLAVRRKLEDASYRFRRSHAHCRRWCWRRRHAPPVCKPNPNLNQRPPWALFCLKLDNSCCYARYSSSSSSSKMQSSMVEYHALVAYGHMAFLPFQYMGGGRYSDSRYSDISKSVMQWVRVRVRDRVRARAKVC